MTLNSGIFELMGYTQQNEYNEPEYKNKDGLQGWTTGAKDLEVLLSDDGKFHEQILKISLNGKKKAG